MITLPLNKYYFISTVITTTNQSYHINTYYIFTQPLSRFLDFGFNDFIGLKNMSVAVGPVAQCWVPDTTPHKEPGPSKIIPPTDHTWLGIRRRPTNILQLYSLVDWFRLGGSWRGFSPSSSFSSSIIRLDVILRLHLSSLFFKLLFYCWWWMNIA